MDSIKFGENQFCGPSAIAALVGCNTDTAEHYIQSASGRYGRIKGVTNQEMVKTLDLLGYDCVPFEMVEDGTLFGSIPYVAVRDGDYLVNIPGHYITLESKDGKVRILDNHTREPLNIAASARLSQRVEKCWKVIQREKKPVKEITYSKRRIFVEVEIDKRDGNVQADGFYLTLLRDHVSCLMTSGGPIKSVNCTISTIMEPDE